MGLATIDHMPKPENLVRLWRHECLRVFSDRLINKEDRDFINEEIQGLIANIFTGFEDKVLADPILFGDYITADPLDEESEDPRLYEDLSDYDKVQDKMNKMLEDYGYDNKPMDLVLFNDALEHITKIHRIIRFPRGNALLVGVGGSGKQSLTRLATFTAGYKVMSLNLVRNYREAEFREDLRAIYEKVVLKPITFLFTDAHVVEAGFLELINNMLTIGMVPALFPEEEKEGLTSQIEDAARKDGCPENKEAKWAYFVNRCRDNMHIVMAMSPAGDTLRVRCRNFPGLVSSSSIDWFFPWPEEALTSVANHFLIDVKLEDAHRIPITEHIVMVHLSVQDYSDEFMQKYKRPNFSTPKNYLDFIKSYSDLLTKNRKNKDALV